MSDKKIKCRAAGRPCARNDSARPAQDKRANTYPISGGVLHPGSNEVPKETESFRGRGLGESEGTSGTMCRVETLFPRKSPWELADDKDTAEWWMVT